MAVRLLIPMAFASTCQILNWDFDADRGSGLDMEWIEMGGLPAVKGERVGFGSKFLWVFAMSLGSVEVHYLETGLKAVIRIDSGVAPYGTGSSLSLRPMFDPR